MGNLLARAIEIALHGAVRKGSGLPILVALRASAGIAADCDACLPFFRPHCQKCEAKSCVVGVSSDEMTIKIGRKG